MNFGLFKKDTHSMNIKDLEVITKIYEEIKSIDVKIDKLHKLAQSAVNSELEINLNITNIKVKEKSIKDSMINENGDLNYPSASSSNSSSFSISDMDTLQSSVYKSIMTKQPVSFTINKSKSYDSFHNELLSDELSLKIFGILIEDRKTKKDKLIKKLSSKYNITI